MRILYLLPILTITVLLTACGNGNNSGTKSTTNLQAKGGVKYGGVFRENETEYYRSLFPQNITEVVGHRITNQVYEGLVTLNQKDLSIEPSLAESWTVNDSATIFTFKIRKGVFFHPHESFEGGKGREVTAQDFAYCLELLCKKSATNQGFWLFDGVVKGAKNHYESPSESTLAALGIKALDATTLQITLEKPYAGFLYRLAMPFCAVFPKELYEKKGEAMRDIAVGTGPFIIKKVLQDEGVYLARNESYWKKDEFGNSLPYLDGIKFSFIKEEKTEMLEFRKGNLEMKYRLPLDAVNDIIDENGNLKGEYKAFEIQKATELSLQYYGFLHTHPIFSNLHVRKAFCYAIDRKKIVDYTVKGEGIPAFNGIVPLGMNGYNNEAVKGFTFDPAKAKEELKLAGFENGKNFPKITLQINSGGGRNEKVAEAITAMLKENLNVEVVITQLPFAQHLENYETGKAAFWRAGWVADYPDPENFLTLCYGKHVPAKPTEKAYLNAYRYKNAAYDKLFEEALATTNFEKRNQLYEQLDQIAINDAVMLPIYYTINRRLIQPYVKNFPVNGMEYRNYREVWFDKK
ncbi:MAG: ABC transporter substrate-binding protein [Chitinophagales bacterium]|nr:ABC transporter substrate-binding protein [Chitinophagales bacterium]